MKLQTDARHKRERIAGLLLLSFLALIFAVTGAAPAKARTYVYVGPAWSTSACHTATGFSIPPCTDGYISGTAVFSGLSANYTGNLISTGLSSWTLHAGSVGGLSSGSNFLPMYKFSFYTGNLTGWLLEAYQSGSYNEPVIETQNWGGGPSDVAAVGYPPSMGSLYGWGNTLGFWYSAKQLGRPAPIPQVPDPTPPPPTAQKPPKTCNNPLSQCGDPIDIGSGNVFEQVTDYTTVGTNPLAFIRYYNSMSTPDTLSTTLGRNWRSNYDRYLRVVSATEIDAERADGQIINFTLSGGVWSADTDVDATLTNSGSTYTLTGHDDTIETYTVSGSTGTLNTIALPNGYTETLNYTSGVLTSVSDSYSRTLTLSYTSGLLTGVSTPDSATLTYGYTAVGSQNELTSVTYNTSPSTSQTYVYGNTSYPFALTGITDENGNSYASWTYDSLGRCTMSEHAGGADEVQVSYPNTVQRVVTNPLGEQETYTFAYKQGVQKVTSIARAASSPVVAATRSFTYDTNGYLATATDWNGNSTHYTNNSHGLPTSITEAYGAGVARTTTISYDSTWVRKPYTITKTNVTVDDRYDSSTGNLLTQTLTDTTSGSTPYSSNGQTRVWTYTYDGTGELLTAQTPRTDLTLTTTYTYTSGALASTTDALGNVTTINTANGTGQPTKITDPNSVETDLVYDNRNRLTSKTIDASPSNEVTGFTYIASGQPYVITLPDSSTVTFGYDTAQRLTTVTNTAGETINYTLNAAGKATTTTIKDSGGTTRKSSTATYDVLAHMLTLVGSAGATQTTSFAWDGQGNRKSVTDANSKVYSLAWDALNRASTITDPLTHTAAPTYDNLDNITAQTDFDGYSTSFIYNGFHDAKQKASPDTGTAVYHYDEDHNQTKRVDARSVETDRTFDKLERPLTETFPSYSSENIAYTYDDTSGGNKGIGHLTGITDESGSTTLVYDNFGNVTSSVRVIGSQTYTTSYSYDLANRTTQIVYPSGRIVNYTYDSSGYLTQVDTKPTSGGSDTVLASSILHKPFGPVASFTYGNSEAQTRTYDNNYWLDDLVTTYSGTDIQNLTYSFDYAGNLTSITDNDAAGRDETYTVDSLNRLHTASGAYGSRTYTYDNNSNRSTWYNGTITRTSTLTASKNRLASITDGTNTRHFTYSASGNMLTDDRVMNGAVAVSDTFGGRDRLESMTVGTPTITFKINGLGQRVEKATVSATTDYHFDLGSHIIGESDDSTGNDIVEYVWMGAMMIAQIDSSGNIFYVHSDQVANPQKMTDASRTLVWDREQEPFGETYATPTNTTPTNHRFPGQYADAEDLLSYSGMRNYDSTLGRFPEADPTGFGGGLNLFGYAGQNPTELVDPSGLWAVGVSFDYSTINSAASNSGGAHGWNLECTSTNGCHLYTYDTPKDSSGVGFDTGAGLSCNVATGDGAWTGGFDNVMGSYSVANASYFVSSAGEGDYQGGSIGVGRGLPGVAVVRTNYQRMYPDPYIYPQPPPPPGISFPVNGGWANIP